MMTQTQTVQTDVCLSASCVALCCSTQSLHQHNHDTHKDAAPTPGSCLATTHRGCCPSPRSRSTTPPIVPPRTYPPPPPPPNAQQQQVTPSMSRLLHLPLLLLLLPVLAPAFLLPAPRVALPSLHSTVEGADYPSDTADPDLSLDTPASAGGNGAPPPPIADSAKLQLRENFKCQIYKNAAKLNRGQLANLDQKNEMINVVAQLEALGSGRSVDAEDVEGVWELVYTDVEPFRASPFFQTVGKVMGGTTLSAEDFFRLHRLATRGSEIGKVRQIITSQELVSEVEIISGIPSIPFAISGTVVTRATAQRTQEGALKLTLKSSGVQSSSVFALLGGGGNLPELPLAELAERVGLFPPSVLMTTYYVDANMRVSRDEDDHFYVWGRGHM